MWDVQYLRGCHLGCCHVGHTVSVGFSSGILSRGCHLGCCHVGCTVSVGLSSEMLSRGCVI